MSAEPSCRCDTTLPRIFISTPPTRTPGRHHTPFINTPGNMSRKPLRDQEQHTLGHDSDSDGGSTDLEEEAQLISPTAPGASTFSLAPSTSEHASSSSRRYKDFSQS